MSSSSTTACSRSPSPSPATPESSDNIEAVVNQDDLSAWRDSLSPASYLIEDEAHFSSDKREIDKVLDLEDLLQDGAYEDPASSGTDAYMQLDHRVLSKLLLPREAEAADMLVQPHSPISIMKPVPPPPTQLRKDLHTTAQRVVCPPKESCYNLPIIVPSIPEGGTKSRVETQVRLTVDLAHASASSGEPLKYDRVGTWKWLRLPKGTSTKKRTRKEGKVEASLEDSLYLTVEVTCASPPHTRVTCCSSCQAREAKRVAKKIAARVRPARSDSDSQEEAPTIPGRGRHEDNSNVVQFNCPEILDFSAGSVVLPLRITCYCRHHREKVGFNVHFGMLDYTGRTVGTGVTRPIMITDDHKSTGVNAQKSMSNGGELKSNSEWPFVPIGDQSDAGLSSKRKKIRGDNVSERTRKRTKPYDIGQRGIRRDSSGSLESPSNATSAIVSRSSTPLQSLTKSPLTQSPILHLSPSEQMPLNGLHHGNGQVTSDHFEASFDAPSSVINQMLPATFDRDPTMTQLFDPETISLQQLATSYLPPSSPEELPMALDPAKTLNVPQPAPFTMFKNNPPPPIAGLPPPKIHRLIPSSGPTYGGIEVTVLGANFHPSMQLNCVFGGAPSTTTQRWSDNTLVCLLPPSASPGIVPVWFEGILKEDDGTLPCLFSYTDETDRTLMELALQVVGLKMTGKIEDARNVAMRIVGNTDSNDSGAGMGTISAMQLAGGSQSTPDFRRLLLSRASDSDDFEKVIISFLSMIDIPMTVPTVSLSSCISHQTASGQTLLHLATLAKFSALVKFLIAHGIDIDARDKNGCTAVFFAAVIGASECAQVLIDAGAALDVVNGLGKTPIEVADTGFFNFLSSGNCTLRRVQDQEIDDGDDEAAWGDVEEESEDTLENKTVARRKSTLRKRRHTHAIRDADHKRDQDPSTGVVEDKKALEAELTDEKQVVSFMETVSRALAQWQNPQGMIPNMANLPLPHLPQLPSLPAMPTWNALPQIPAVFPVFVPIPTLSALWGEKRAEERQSAQGDKGNNARPWLTQDWRTMWEKLITQVNASARPTEEISDAPPPAYSPRDSTSTNALLSIKASEDIASSSAVPRTATLNKPMLRHMGYESLPIPEQEVNAYAYRPAHKPSRKQQKKNDRMLILFWIPILLIGLFWAFLHFVRVAFHATRTVLSFKAGLRV